MLYQVGSTFGRLPSEIVGIESSWVAYQFDAAVLYAGRTVERENYERQQAEAEEDRELQKEAEKWGMTVDELRSAKAQTGESGSEPPARSDRDSQHPDAKRSGRRSEPPRRTQAPAPAADKPQYAPGAINRFMSKMPGGVKPPIIQTSDGRFLEYDDWVAEKRALAALENGDDV